MVFEDADDIMKCACGLPMRRREWDWHWAECAVYRLIEVSGLDRKRLLANEKMRG